MAISLSKNQAVSLEKETGAGLKKVSMGLACDLSCNAPRSVRL